VMVNELARMDNAFALMWGAEDLFAATGGTANRWPDGSYRDVAKHVRSQALLAAKAYGRMALDSVYLDIKDLDGLRAEVDDAVAVGFDAKVAIHPTQVAVIRDGYAPTAADGRAGTPGTSGTPAELHRRADRQAASPRRTRRADRNAAQARPERGLPARG